MRITLYAGPPLQAALEAAGSDNRSGRVNAIAARYMRAVAEELRAVSLSRAEWCAVLDTLNGIVADEAAIGTIWAEIADCTGLGEKWGVDQEELTRRVRALPWVRKLAVVEASERFWERADIETDAGLAAAGIRPSDG